MEDVAGAGIVDGSEAQALVEASCASVFCAEADGAEAFAGFFNESEHEGAAYTLTAPGGADVDFADSAYFWILGERVDVEAAYGYEVVVVKGSAEGFARGVEAIFGAGPLFGECFDEAVAFCLGFGEEQVEAGDRERHFLYGRHVVLYVLSRGCGMNWLR